MLKFLWRMTRRAFKRLYGRTTAAQKFVTWLITLLLALMALIGPVLNPLLSPILSAQIRQDIERLVAKVPSWFSVVGYAAIFLFFLFCEAYLEVMERDQRITDLRTRLGRYEAATLRLAFDPEDSSCRQEDIETMPRGLSEYAESSVESA